MLRFIEELIRANVQHVPVRHMTDTHLRAAFNDIPPLVLPIHRQHDVSECGIDSEWDDVFKSGTKLGQNMRMHVWNSFYNYHSASASTTK